MIDRDNKLPVARQAKRLGISRANVYYLPRTESEADLALMRRIDELHLERPFAGARSGLIPALTQSPPMRSTLIRCRNDWQLNPQIFHLTSFGNCLNEWGQLFMAFFIEEKLNSKENPARAKLRAGLNKILTPLATR